MKNTKPKILIIGTGGAISAKNIDNKFNYGEITQNEIIDKIPEIKNQFEIETTNLFRMDSSDIKPEQWLTLANTIYYKMDKYDGIIVTMGTDTLSYAASAISFIIQKNNIPIIFTGSVLDPNHINTDSKRNLKQAILVAGKSDIAETLIVFNGKIMRAVNTKKAHATSFETFKNFNSQELGNINYTINFNDKYKKRTNTKPILYQKIETNVGIMKVYPGFEGKRITNLIDLGAKGIVLESFGLGNMPLIDSNIQEGIKYANSKKVPIVIASNCELGKNWQQLYKAEIGQRLDKIKAIPVYDMLPETAYVKLMWVLGQTEKFEEIKKMMQKNYVGEISSKNAA